jgi:hypothetical protein
MGREVTWSYDLDMRPELRAMCYENFIVISDVRLHLPRIEIAGSGRIPFCALMKLALNMATVPALLDPSCQMRAPT